MSKYFKTVIIFALIFVNAFSVFSEDVKKPLTLSFTGDMMAHVINYSMSDYSLIYKDIEYLIKYDDLSFSNVEFPVNPFLRQASYPVFNIHPKYVKAAINAGIDVMSIANNHTNDQGTSGLLATVEAFNSLVQDYKSEGRDIYFAGASNTQLEEPEIKTINIKGWKIGYTSATQFSNRKTEDKYLTIINIRDKDERQDYIDWLSKAQKDYDLFILAFHGGVEYRTEPIKYKTLFFQQAADAGVDIIWSHHPHVVQPIDVIKYEDRETVIMNSMGNFISGQGRIADPVLPEEEWSYTGDSAIVQLKLSFDGKNPRLEKLSAIPIANIMDTNRDVVITPIEELTHRAVPEPWKSFFIQRFILMHDFFSRNIRYHESQVNLE
ncbi:MAG: CapA family protein [Spirochaetales bacterium]|nr:CapA family protein [Spirochaetales bacterium]